MLDGATLRRPEYHKSAFMRDVNGKTTLVPMGTVRALVEKKFLVASEVEEASRVCILYTLTE